MPTEPPDCEKIAALIPTAWPWALMSGPPLLPGLIDASVWMKSSYGPSPITRPVALTMPVVTVCSSPNGLPIAITGSPTWRREESPSGITGSPVASTLRSAMSVFGSRPRSRPGSSRPSASVTLISVAPSTTWLLVTMKPAELITKPEPRLRTMRRGRPPKNWSKNWLPASTRLVLMLTTAGLRARASSTQGDAAGAEIPPVTGRSVQSAASGFVKPNRESRPPARQQAPARWLLRSSVSWDAPFVECLSGKLAQRAGRGQPPDLGVFAGHAVHVAGAAERRREEQTDLR